MASLYSNDRLMALVRAGDAEGLRAALAALAADARADFLRGKHKGATLSRWVMGGTLLYVQAVIQTQRQTGREKHTNTQKHARPHTDRPSLRCQNGHLSVVQFLAENGGDLNARDW
nr:uncharacterized protein LOC113828808 [Penaeus vannamei]